MKKIYGSTNIDMEKFSELVIFGLLLINWKSYTSDLALKTTLSKNRMRIIFFNVKIVNQLFMIHAFNHVSMLIQSR
jgi:succinate-acetate transporter protein